MAEIIRSNTLELVEQAQTGCERAKTVLIEENSPLIKSIVKRFKNRGVEYADLYQLGSIGFLKAIANFDLTFGVKFSTYAVPMITGEIKRFLRDDGYIKVSRQTKTLAHKIAYFIEDYKKKNDEKPPINTIAKHLQVDPQDIVFALEAAQKPVSMFEKLDDSENSRSLIDTLQTEPLNDDMLDLFVLKQFIEKLPTREKKIIILRFFRDKTQSEIAATLGVSQVQVSRLETKIIERMRQEFEVEAKGS
ncbi:MAG: SigB/SigF/SigG family RNA polymerase sigma factor [Firmicutes bacterium]|nr:SigB/SigF/SigG family RNA polymerase sigma factor [Bacillota bacterium]